MHITVQKALNYGAQTLKDHHVPGANLDARVLLQHVLHTTVEALIRSPDASLQETEWNVYLSLISRRAQREPLSHLTEKREFFGRTFSVTADTLDPRADSESLIEQVLNYFKDKERALDILDMGTGTGCLLLTVLSEYKNARGTGIDICPKALAVAHKNAIQLGLENRASFLVKCWADGLKEAYDLIISNPPYIKDNDIHTLQPEVARYEPRLALSGGEDGLMCYRQLAPYLSKLLKQEGKVVLECGDHQEREISLICEQYELKTIAYGHDLTGVVRCIVLGRNDDN